MSTFAGRKWHTVHLKHRASLEQKNAQLSATIEVIKKENARKCRCFTWSVIALFSFSSGKK
jgi:hypothetical protein